MMEEKAGFQHLKSLIRRSVGNDRPLRVERITRSRCAHCKRVFEEEERKYIDETSEVICGECVN